MTNRRCALITGVCGQDGQLLARHLIEGLKSTTYQVVGTSRTIDPGGPLLETLDSTRFKLRFFDGEDDEFRQILEQERPNEIYHLAAPSVVPDSWQRPFSTSAGVAGPLDAIIEYLRANREVSLFYASSSEVFGRQKLSKYSEDTIHCPVTPYGVSKSHCQKILSLIRQTESLRIFNGILFNHESFLRPESFVTMKVCAGMKRFLTDGSPIELGNLDSSRDWGLAIDFVKIFHDLVTVAPPDDYVIGTGRSITVRAFVTAVAGYFAIELDWRGKGLEEIALCSKSKKTVVKVNPAYFRSIEPESPVSDVTKLVNTIGYHPSQNLNRLVANICSLMNF